MNQQIDIFKWGVREIIYTEDICNGIILSMHRLQIVKGYL